MTIEELLKIPVGKHVSGFGLTIKTMHKKWGDYQQVTLADDTGNMIADFKMSKGHRPARTWTPRIIVAEIRDNPDVPGTTLLHVEEWSVESLTEPPVFVPQQEQDITRGKVRHGLTCAFIRAGTLDKSGVDDVKKTILYWAEFIMTGK